MILMIVSLATVGFSSWITNVNTSLINVNTDRNNKDKKVCYIKGATEADNIYFTTIERALEVGSQNAINDEIYVIPGTNPVITRTCTIDTLDSLYIPYEGETYFSQVNSNYEKGSLAYSKEANRKNLITIKENVTFNVLGNLFVGGIQSGGSGSAYYSGHTCSSYTEIHLQKEARIISFGEIVSYGYISGTFENNKPVSQIVFENGSLTYLPFVVREHRGGSIFLGMAGKDAKELRSMIMKMLNAGTKVTAKMQTSPFNRFFINNLYSIEFKFNYGSKLTGKASMYADNQFNNADVGLIGNTAQYFLKTAEKTIIKGYFSKDLEKCYLDIFGSLEVTSLKLQLHVHKEKSGIVVDGDVILSTTDILFPISHHFNITLNKFIDGGDAIIDCKSQGFKFMPSSTLIINQGVNVIVKRLSIYQYDDLYPNNRYIVTGNVGCNSPYEVIKDTEGNYIECNIVNNGILTVEELGGLVNTTSPSGILNITKSNSIISKEIVSTEEGKITIMGITLQTYMAPIYHDVNKTAQGYLDRNDNLADLGIRTYTSGGNYRESIEREYNIKYYKIIDDNSPAEISAPEGNPTTMKSSQTLKFVNLPDEGNNKFVNYYAKNYKGAYVQLPIEQKGSALFDFLENNELKIYIKYSSWNRAKINFYDHSGNIVKTSIRVKGDILNESDFLTSLINDFETVGLDSTKAFYHLYYNYCVGWALKEDVNKTPINSFVIPDDISDLQNIDFVPLIDYSKVGEVITITDSSKKGTIELVDGNISYVINGVTYYQRDSTFNITIENSIWPVGANEVRINYSDGTTSDTYRGYSTAAGLGDKKVFANIPLSKNGKLVDV